MSPGSGAVKGTFTVKYAVKVAFTASPQGPQSV
jgi:hypothetical protein